jgi:hypothetical protein
MSKFNKAVKSQSKLRCAIFGPSGSGKTYTALRISKGLGGRTALIDTERGSASKYADRFEFDVAEAIEHGIDALVGFISDGHGYDNLIIDSLSHSWQELLEDINRIAKAKYQGNTWSAWNEGTPKQKRLVNAILNFPGHVLATMRSKTEWVQEKNEQTGKNKPVRVGLAPEQGKGIEYEFDMLLELNPEHFGTVLKDRTGKFQDQIIEKPGEDFGIALAKWLTEGEVAQAMPEDPSTLRDKPLCETIMTFGTVNKGKQFKDIAPADLERAAGYNKPLPPNDVICQARIKEYLLRLVKASEVAP